MTDPNKIERIGTPLHEQLLVLIPMIKALEDHRESLAHPLPPLLLEIEHHEDGALTVELGDAPVRRDDRPHAELTLAIYRGSTSKTRFRYDHAFALTWSFISRNTPMNAREYQCMYEAFWLSWATHLFEFEKRIARLRAA